MAIPQPPLLLLFLLLLPDNLTPSQAQQSYVNNKQLDHCEQNSTTTLGFICNGVASSCPSFLTFRSTSIYNSPIDIAYLLSADASQIAAANNISDVEQLPPDTLIVVPINCSCHSGNYYQQNASYTLKQQGETYFTVANNTYQALTTCQAMESQNPYDARQLYLNMRLAVPLRCACPTRNQTAAGFRYLLTYLIRRGDTSESIARAFAGAGADVESINTANELSPDSFIYYFTPLLVPLKIEPTKQNINAVAPPPPPSTPPPPTTPSSETRGSNSNKGIFIGVGIGAFVLVLFASILAAWFLWYRRRPLQHESPSPPPPKLADESGEQVTKTFSSWSVLSEGIRISTETLTVYKLADLEKATESFSDSNQINGSFSVYLASFNGDDAVVKIMKGDVSREIEALRQINHSRIVRLSGFCEHHGQTYLVYEYAENGPLSDWLHPTLELQNKHSPSLDWKQRIQIAYDIADALNYLHNFTSPPYIHKNLASSNILLDSTMRAKVTNFGLSRTLDTDNNDHAVPVMTRHVVGTQGYMAPEYVENGLVTSKLDVYALGVVMLELLSGREPVAVIGKEGGEQVLVALSESIEEVLGGENVMEKLRGFMDPRLQEEYPLALAYSVAQLARRCVGRGLDDRPAVSEVLLALSKIWSSSMDWDPSYS